MKKYLRIGIFFIFALAIFIEKNKQGEVLSEEILSPVAENIPSPTPSSIPSKPLKSPLLTPSENLEEPFITSIPTPTKNPTPSLPLMASPTSIPTTIPQPQFSSKQINSFIERFSAQYGVDPNVMRHLALCESGFNPSAKKLNYAGLFQFNSSTWVKYRKLLGEDSDPNLRFNAEEAVQTTAFAISLGKTYLWPNCYPK